MGSVPHVLTQPPAPDPDAEAVLTGTTRMTREERRKRLESLVRAGAPDHIIRASKELEAMEKAEVKEVEVGPPPPQTLADAVAEVADIVEALAAWGGEGAVKEAVTRGLKYFYAQAQEHKDVQPNVATPSVQGADQLDLPRGESEASAQ